MSGFRTRFLRFRFLFVAAATALCAASVARADLPELLKRTPPAANLLVIINATEIYKSPLAVRENWQAEHEKGLSVGGFVLPPGVQQMLIASEMDIEFLQPMWNAAIASLQAEPEWDKIAEREHGIRDSIQGANAVRLPGDIYLVSLGNNMAGMMSPANRQRVSQWVMYTGGTPLTPYLKRAAGYVQGLHSEIVIALDVQNAVSRDLIRNRLEGFPIAKIPMVNLDDLANNLASIEGATLGISITDSTQGKIRFDFGGNVEPLLPYAKHIFMEILERHGASIPDFASWKATAKGNTIYLEGNLSESGLRRILSLVEMPTGDLRPSAARATTVKSSTTPPPPNPNLPKLPGPPGPGPNTIPNSPSAGQPEESVVRISSQSFFKSVNKYLVDLRNERGTGNSYASQALWYDKYARYIDKLPSLNVDPELLQYASQTSNNLRNASLAVKGVGIVGEARAKQITPQASGVVNYYNPYYRAGGMGYGYGYGANYGSVAFDLRDINSERRAVRGEELAKGATAVQTIMSTIDRDTANVRRTMTQKYQSEF